jgi:nucleoside-diphosphate-sugar epimerase
MKIVIIGCGYVGSAAARHWRQKGHHITATTRSPVRIPQLQSIVDQVVVLDGLHFSQILKDQDVVLVTVAPDRGASYEEVYLETARAVVDQLDDSVKSLIYTSSTSVYGDHQGVVVDETTPLFPETPQAKALVETEQVFLNCKKVRSCILRLGEVVGPGRTLLQRLRRMQGSVLPGHGESMTNFSPLTDIVEGLDFALTHSLAGVYNLCNDFHLQRRELYDQLCDQTGMQKMCWDAKLTGFHAGNKMISSQKIINRGFQFRSWNPLDEGY